MMKIDSNMVREIRTEKKEKLDSSLMPRFILPVAAENIFTILIGLLIAQVNSTISPSALAAIGMANSVMTVIMSLFSMVMTGSCVLVNRRIGERDLRGASETIEQSVLLGTMTSVAITALCVVLTKGLLRLLMPGAEKAMLDEAVTYFRILSLSMPAYVIHGTLSALSRAQGDSRTPLLAAVCMNIAQVLLAWLLIGGCHLNEVGAGLAYIGCRLVGAVIMMISMMGKRARIPVEIKNMLHPRGSICLQIIRIGVPVSLESIFVQLGYMLAGSMSIGLGTFESGVYQIMNTLNNFATVPQGIVSTVAMTAVGHLLGAGRLEDARKAGRKIFFAGMTATIFLGVFNIVTSPVTSGLYSTDPEAIRQSSASMWILLIMNIAGISINVVDPQLRSGGDVKFVMTNTLVAVWLVRLPLTYLFAYVMDLGVPGIYLANVVSLWERAICGLVRKKGDKWIKKI